ncbi:carbon storage regulator [Pseudomonas sp. RW409]|nr:carbon storage regulator [Pseudomonas sp. RW409]
MAIKLGERMLLVITIKLGKCLHISEDIQIKITKVTGRYVAVGIDAPRCMKVLLGELSQPAKDSNGDNKA